MPPPDAERLRAIKSFPSLVKYLRDDLEWPIESDDFEELTYEYEPEELGLDPKSAVKVKEIKQLRPLVTGQPWGIFFINFEPKRLPVVVLRRILRALVVKKRQSANKSHQAVWKLHDLLFISSYGETDHRDLTFAHFSEDSSAYASAMPTLRVLGWDDEDTILHLDHAHRTLKDKLRWPDDEKDVKAWRDHWSSAFTIRQGEVIRTSKDLAVRMAELATSIRKRVHRVLAVESEKGPIRKLMTAFREALIHDLTEDDFADMYAQTITYGLLTARVSRHAPDDSAKLEAENLTDMVPITNPFLKDLLATFLTVGGRKGAIDFDELGVNDVVDALRAANMEAVLRDFGDRNPQEDPVIHFYELFLKEYDPKKRMQRGVFYTPRPVVSYIVRSVHELLQTEFGLEDGLASTVTWGEVVKKHKGLKLPTIKESDKKTGKETEREIDPGTPFVQILDPATGTATFLVEVIDVIHKTMVAKWKKQGHTEMFDIPQLWNEYVPQHLLPRLYGFELMMAPYAIAHMKIGLKLHETGYRFGSDERARVYMTNSLEPAHEFPEHFNFDAPALAHEAEAVNEVKRHRRFTVVIGNPPYSVISQNSGDWIVSLMALYKEDVREERNIQPLSDDYVKFLRLGHFIIELSGIGVLSLITNHTYLNGVIHRGLRRQLLSCFSSVSALDLHGSALLGLESPDGEADQNVFDIQQGVSIAAFVRHCGHEGQSDLRRADLWGSRQYKYEVLAGRQATPKFSVIETGPPFFFFEPSTSADEAYELGISVNELIPQSSAGFVTGKDESLISFDSEPIAALVKDLANRRITDDVIAARYMIKDTSGWAVSRRRLDVADDSDRYKKIIRVTYRPFDDRFTFYCDFLQRSRYSVFRHLLQENIALVTSRLVKGEEPAHFFVSRFPVEKIFLSPKTSNNAFVFPVYHYGEQGQIKGFGDRHSAIDANVARRIAVSLGLAWVDSDDGKSLNDQALRPEDLLGYTYAVFFSPTYRTRYSEFLKIDFPRLPLTSSLELFKALAKLGGELVALHLLESPSLDNPITTWRGKTPSGKIEKITYADETVCIGKARTEGFTGVPEAVWNFHIGGYQVCNKWLKDRKDRQLSADDIAHYQKIVAALHETIRLMKEIDEVIEKHGGWPGAFVTDKPK